MEEKELLVKIVDVAERIPGYWCSICLRGWPVEKILYIQVKFKNGVLVAKEKENGEWVSEWEDAFSPPVRIDCCLDCFKKLVEEMKKL